MVKTMFGTKASANKAFYLSIHLSIYLQSQDYFTGRLSRSSSIKCTLAFPLNHKREKFLSSSFVPISLLYLPLQPIAHDSHPTWIYIIIWQGRRKAATVIITVSSAEKIGGHHFLFFHAFMHPLFPLRQEKYIELGI